MTTFRSFVVACSVLQEIAGAQDAIQEPANHTQNAPGCPRKGLKKGSFAKAKGVEQGFTSEACGMPNRRWKTT